MAARKQTLSPRDLAQVVGVSESSLKRWADDGLLQISRTAGGHRRIDLAEAAAYIRRSGLPINDPAPLGLTHLTTLAETAALERLDFLMVDAIRRGDSATACGLTLKLYLSGRSVCEICDGPIKHALRPDPIAANNGPSAVSDAAEIQICMAALEQLTELLPPSRDQSAAVVIIDPAPPNAMGARMMLTVLTAERWQKSEASLATLLAAVGDRHAQLVAAPAALMETVEPQQVAELAQHLEQMACRMVLVGARAAHPAKVSTVESMSEFASLVRCVEAINAGPLQ